MRKLGVAALVWGLGLGCSSSSDKGSVAVDPAALDFCLQWANEVCRLAYLCVEPGAQSAEFHSRYGASKDDCWEGLEKRCLSNQSDNQAFGPSCGPGKQLDTDLSTPCTQVLEAETCASWMVAPAGGCELACHAAPASGGAGNAGGASNVAGAGNRAGSGNAGTGGSGSNATAASTPEEFCTAENNVLCDRLFECDPSASSQYSSVAICKTVNTGSCSSGEFCKTSFDASKAAACVKATLSASCADLMGQPPETCLTACR